MNAAQEALTDAAGIVSHIGELAQLLAHQIEQHNPDRLHALAAGIEALAGQAATLLAASSTIGRAEVRGVSMAEAAAPKRAPWDAPAQ